MADKDFKTIKEQIEILRSRGLTINDEPRAGLWRNTVGDLGPEDLSSGPLFFIAP